MSKADRPIDAQEVLAALPPERQARIRTRGAELIAEEYALRDLRRAERITQAQVAERLGGRQVYVSRLENRADMKLSTLRAYVQAIGGDLQLMVTFPEGRAVRLKEIGEAETGAPSPEGTGSSDAPRRASRSGRGRG